MNLESSLKKKKRKKEATGIFQVRDKNQRGEFRGTKKN